MSIHKKLQGLLFIIVVPFLFAGTYSLFTGKFFNLADDNIKERFNLTNYTVFTPGSEVAVNLFSSYKSGSQFHFRLFKIDEPEKFFTSTDKNLLRRNFDIWGKNRQTLLQFTKLVKEWDAVISNPSMYGGTQNVHVGKINEPGMYILQAFRDDQVAYCGISVSNLAMIYKNSGKQILAMVVDSKSGTIIPETKFSLFNDTLLETKSSDKNGLALFSINDSIDFVNQNVLLMAKTKDETIFSDPYFYFRSEMKNYTAYIYTNQPVYRPGQQVFFKAILREKNGDVLSNIPGEDFEIKIKTPKNKEVFSQSLKTNEFGSLSGDFKLDKDAELGTYSIQIFKGEQSYYGSFDVEEYKKPEYFVKVETEKNHYAGNDTIKAVVSAGYYFGSPVTNGKVSVKIYRQNFWRPWWYWSPYSWFYSSFSSHIINEYGQRQLISEQSGELNKEGKFNFTYKIDRDIKADYSYLITAEVTDNSRSTISGSSSVFVTRGSFTLSTSPDKYFVPKGTPVDIRVNASDFSDKPVQTTFLIVVNYPRQKGNNNYYQPVSDTLSGTTDTLGKAIITFLPRGFFTGNYNYKVLAYDEKGREISARNSFFIGTGKEYYFYYNRSDLEIITDKDSYEKGDSLTAYILLPQNNTDVLVTFESDTFLGYEVKHVEGNSLTIKLKLSEKYSPSFNIAAAYMKDGILYNASKLVGVLDKDKFLNIAIKPSKETYKPGDEANYKIDVTDNNGNPVKNTELSFGVVDESIYAIKEDQTQDIKSFFYAPRYSYIPIYNSRQNSNYNGSSRIATLADEKINLKNAGPKGNGNLSGKMITIKGKVDFKNIYALLSSSSFFYKTEVDSLGNYLFKNIKKDKFNLLALLDNGDVLSAGEITVENNSKKDIDLGDYTNTSPFPQPIRVWGGRGIPRVNAMALQDVREKSETISTQQEMPNSFIQPVLRSNFVDAAVWKANVVTDENGEAQISFKMPDNLTAWRATVRGITKNSVVGQNTGKVITRKNLLVRIEPPRFFREGDELTVSTIVHNYLSESKNVKVNFDPKGLEIVSSKINQAGYSDRINNLSKRSYEINVDKDSEVRIDWNVKVTEPIGEAKLKAEALTNEESDAVELKVPIHPNGIKKVEALTDDFSGDGIKNLAFNIPPKVDLRTAKFSFSAAPSLAGTILKALGDLVGYPYGCVEQTMSRFLPTIIVANTFKEINAPLNDKIIQELPQMVDAGLKRLYSFQHPDGGWGWWMNDQTHPYMTAYVIYGMSLAEKAGYKIDSLSYHEGIKNLIDQIKNTGSLDFTTKAFMLYSLSTAIQEKTIDTKSYRQMVGDLLKEELNPYSLSLLAITLHNFNDDSLLTKVLDRLQKMAVEESSFAYWGGKTWHYSWQDDKVQSTAFAAKALLLNKNNLPLITKAVRWLMQQKQGFSWRSTQETASVIFSLTDYLKFTHELNPDFNFKVFVNNKLELEKKFSKDYIFQNNPTVTIDGMNDKILKHGENKIKIIKTGEGKLYFSGLNEFYSTEIKPDAKDKFIVSRDYYILKPENRGDRIVYVKEKLNGNISSGQILFVKTHVECKEKDLQYFILEDYLPSGFEAVKDEKNFEIEGENDYHPINYWGMRPRHWFYADKEYHDDKVSFFVTNVQDEMDFSYIIQAQIPGNYNITPAQCFLMYYPEVNGNSNQQKIIVKE